MKTDTQQYCLACMVRRSLVAYPKKIVVLLAFNVLLINFIEQTYKIPNA